MRYAQFSAGTKIQEDDMRKNAISAIAIILSIIAISAAWPRKNMQVTSLTLKDRSGHIYATIDAEHQQFAIYNPNGKEAVEIQTVKEGTNFIIHGTDGFERIRLSTWASESEGSYIQILQDGWQKDNFRGPFEAVLISKHGVRAEQLKTRNVSITKDPFADRE